MPDDHSQLNSWARLHLPLLVEGQSRLSALVGTDEPQWQLDLATGLLNLNGRRLQCALLGSVRTGDNTWLWSWADPGLDQQAIAVQRARPLRGFGAEWGLWEFAADSFSMDQVVDLGMTPGAALALVAQPQLMGGAIFSGAGDGSRMYAVVTDPRLTMEPPSVFTVPRVLSGAAAYGVGDQREMVMVYASAHQLGIIEAGDLMWLEFDDGTRLEVCFEDGMIRRMNGLTGERQ